MILRLFISSSYIYFDCIKSFSIPQLKPSERKSYAVYEICWRANKEMRNGFGWKLKLFVKIKKRLIIFRIKKSLKFKVVHGIPSEYPLNWFPTEFASKITIDVHSYYHKAQIQPFVSYLFEFLNHFPPFFVRACPNQKSELPQLRIHKCSFQ